MRLLLKSWKKRRKRTKRGLIKKHHLHLKPIQNGDRMLIYYSSLDNQHSAAKKFQRLRWFEPYVVKQFYDNTTMHLLQEFDETELRIPIPCKYIKLFLSWGENYIFHEFQNTLQEVEDEVHKDDHESEEEDHWSFPIVQRVVEACIIFKLNCHILEDVRI